MARVTVETAGESVAVDYSVEDGRYLPAWGGLPIFEDTFDSPTLNTSKWRVRGRGYLGTDTDGYIYPENVFARDGAMVLRTDYRGTTPQADRAWGTGYVDTIGKFSQRFGRFEARIKGLAPGKSRGIWPAFWLRDDSGGGEIDIWEAVGTPCNQPSAYPADGSGYSSTMYRQTGGGTIGTDRTANTLKRHHVQPVDGWHVYACEWTPDRIVTYCDGREILRVDTATALGAQIQAGFPTRAHIRFSQHVGSNWAGRPNTTDTASPAETLIDYVRVWALPSA